MTKRVKLSFFLLDSFRRAAIVGIQRKARRSAKPDRTVKLKDHQFKVILMYSSGALSKAFDELHYAETLRTSQSGRYRRALDGGHWKETVEWSPFGELRWKASSGKCPARKFQPKINDLFRSGREREREREKIMETHWDEALWRCVHLQFQAF